MAYEECDRPVKAELIYRLRDELEKQLRDEVPESDPARIQTAVVSKFTSEIRGIVLSVHADHPLGFTMGRHDRMGSAARANYSAYTLPNESIGGSNWDRLYGTVQVRSLLRNSPALAVGVVEEVKVRIANVVNKTKRLIGYKDKYGYLLWGLRTAADYGYTSGGGNTAVDSHWCDFVAFVTYRRTRE